jgi:hypothetical protein
MATIGTLIERIRAGGVTLAVAPHGRVRYAGPALSPRDVEALRRNRDAVAAVFTLEGRLALGWDRCEREEDPERKATLEAFWIRLLHEYEATCDEVAAQWEGAAA